MIILYSDRSDEFNNRTIMLYFREGDNDKIKLVKHEDANEDLSNDRLIGTVYINEETGSTRYQRYQTPEERKFYIQINGGLSQ